MNEMFIPITKVDAVKGEIWGRAAQEILDKTNEIMDYEASKPNFQKWSDEVKKDSQGKSLGNVRAMHGKVAAGKLIDMVFNDPDKAIDVGCKIVDKDELEKAIEGVYTGFSIGGKYADRKTEDGVTRYTAVPSEISLVDRPCMKTAVFELIKADGVSEQKEFQKIAGREDVNPKEGKEKYGDVKFADEKNKKYPIDTEEHIRAAWNYANKKKNAAKYSAEDIKSIKAKIVAAWKDKIDKDGPPSASEKAEEPYDLKKYLGAEVMDARMAIEALMTVITIMGHEKDEEEEGEDEAEQVKELQAVIDSLKAFIASEIMEETEDEGEPSNPVMAMAEMVGDLEKGDYAGHSFRGNQHSKDAGVASKKAHTASKATKGKDGHTAEKHTKAMEAHKDAMAAHEKAGSKGASSYHNKMASYHGKKAEKLSSKTKKDEPVGDLQKLVGVIEELQKRIEVLEAEPEKPRSAIRDLAKGLHVIGKEDDGIKTDADKKVNEKVEPIEILRKIHRSGGVKVS